MANEPRDLSKIPGFDDRPSIDPESASVLDDMFKQKTEEAAPADPPAPDKPADPPAPDKPADPPAPDEPADPPAPDKPADPPAPDKPADPPAPVPPATDEFDAVALPPYTKPKSVEAFDKVKSLAREKISAVEKERDELKRRAEEAEAKAGQGLPKEVETELKELREFRAKLDVDADPEFATFDTQISQNVESIYAKLKAGGFTDAHIDQIKKLGGPAEVDWDKVAGQMPSTLRRFVESTLVENDKLLEKKNRAVDDAKKNASEYLNNKRQTEASSRDGLNKKTEEGIKQLAPQLGWLEVRKPKEGATAADKAAVEAHNKLVEESNGFLADAAKDDSPELRGILAVGYVQLLKSRADYAALKSTTDAKVAGLEKKLKEVTDLLERVKKSSTTRFRESPSEGSETPKKADDFSTSPGDALDARLKEHLSQK